jgi:dTDP-4-dehydrorhamnose reductase
MRILVTGADGMLATATAEYCRSIGDDVIALNRVQLDIADRTHVFATLKELKPHYLINCAAYTDVDGAETHEELAFAVNSLGVENLASACRSFDIGFVTVSTDYVFNGENPDFYTQRHTPDPLGVYARSKLIGEQKARDSYGRSIVVRSGWIFGEGGTNFLSRIPELLAGGKHIKAISDCFGTPTYAPDLAKRLRELAELDLPLLFHVTNAGPGTSFLGFAEWVSDIGGFDRGLIEPVLFKDLVRPAPRPRSSKLACLFSERLGLEPLPDWEAALARYIGSREMTAGSN